METLDAIRAEVETRQVAANMEADMDEFAEGAVGIFNNLTGQPTEHEQRSARIKAVVFQVYREHIGPHGPLRAADVQTRLDAKLDNLTDRSAALAALVALVK